MMRYEYNQMAAGGQFSRSTLIYGGARTGSAEYALSRRSGEHIAGANNLRKPKPGARYPKTLKITNRVIKVLTNIVNAAGS